MYTSAISHQKCLCSSVACLGQAWVLAAAHVRDSVLAASKAALERMEACRKVFLRGRALALAQRMALYARDELNMSTLRIRVCLSPYVSWTALGQCYDWLCRRAAHACKLAVGLE